MHSSSSVSSLSATCHPVPAGQTLVVDIPRSGRDFLAPGPSGPQGKDYQDLSEDNSHNRDLLLTQERTETLPFTVFPTSSCQVSGNYLTNYTFHCTTATIHCIRSRPPDNPTPSLIVRRGLHHLYQSSRTFLLVRVVPPGLSCLLSPLQGWHLAQNNSR